MVHIKRLAAGWVGCGGENTSISEVGGDITSYAGRYVGYVRYVRYVSEI
jgi:hypothetical protein